MPAANAADWKLAPARTASAIVAVVAGVHFVRLPIIPLRLLIAGRLPGLDFELGALRIQAAACDGSVPLLHCDGFQGLHGATRWSR